MIKAARLLALRGLPVLAALTAVAAFLRFSTLGTQSYWYDEAITVDLVRRPLLGMLSAIPGTESTPPLYYVFAWGWSRIFGTGEVGLRSLSAVLGTATVPAAYAAARPFISQRASLIAAALVAVSPFLVWYSQEARAYALLVFFGTLSLAFMRRAIDPRANRSLAWWAITSSLALATHYFALWLVAAEAAWLLFRCPNRRGASRAVAIVALVAAALLPLAVYQARYSQHTAWISHSGEVGGRAAYLLHQLVIGAYPASHIRPIIVAVPVLVLVGLFAWTERSERDGALLALTLGVAAVGAPFMLALVGDRFLGGRGDYFIYRNLIVATVPLTIPAAAVAGTARAGRAGLVAGLLACSLLVAVSIDIARRPQLQRPDVRAVAAALGPPRVRAILLDARTRLPLRLYLPHLEDMPQQGARVREIDVIEEQGSSKAPRADLPPPRGFRRIQTHHVVQGFTIVHLQSLRRRLVTPAKLASEFPSGREVAILLDAPRS